MMHEANHDSQNDFRDFLRISRDTTNTYLKNSLTEQYDRRRLLELFNQGIIPKLISLHMKVDATKYPDFMTTEVKQLKSLISAAIENAHTLTNEIAPHVLFRAGLKSALHELCKKISDNFSILYYINIQDDISNSLNDLTNMLVYNLAKRLLNGAVRYCCADIVGINIEKYGEYLELMVQDNGYSADDIQEQSPTGQSKIPAYLLESAEHVYSMGGRFRTNNALDMRIVCASIPLQFIEIP